jgi:hypothetical protein
VAALGLIFLFSSIVIRAGTTPETKLRDFKEAPFMGMVYDYNNRPCANALVFIDNEPGPHTDMYGRFVIPSLSRGSHEITIKKDGFEDLNVLFDFISRTQVLHARLISFDQILEMVEEAISQKRFKEAEDLIKRAERIRNRDPVEKYLKAVLLKEKGDFAGAIGVLHSILEGGYGGPYVHLALGNLYQYHLGDADRTVYHLEQYLQQRKDTEVERRLNSLKAGLAIE